MVKIKLLKEKKANISGANKFGPVYFLNANTVTVLICASVQVIVQCTGTWSTPSVPESHKKDNIF